MCVCVCMYLCMYLCMNVCKMFDMPYVAKGWFVGIILHMLLNKMNNWINNLRIYILPVRVRTQWCILWRPLIFHAYSTDNWISLVWTRAIVLLLVERVLGVIMQVIASCGCIVCVPNDEFKYQLSSIKIINTNIRLANYNIIWRFAVIIQCNQNNKSNSMASCVSRGKSAWDIHCHCTIFYCKWYQENACSWKWSQSDGA